MLPLQATAYNPYPTSIGAKALNLVKLITNGVIAVLKFTASIPFRLKNFAALSSAERRKVYKGWWSTIKKEAHHYWVSFPLKECYMPWTLMAL